MTEFNPIDALKRSLNLQDNLNKAAEKDGTSDVANHENANDQANFTISISGKKTPIREYRTERGGGTYDFSKGNGTLDELVNSKYKGASEGEKYAAAREVFRTNSENENLVNAVNDAYVAAQISQELGLECFDKTADNYNPSALFYIRDLAAAARNGEDIETVENLYIDEQTATDILDGFKGGVADKVSNKEYSTFDKDIKQTDIPQEFLDYADYSDVGQVDCPHISTMNVDAKKNVQFDNLFDNIEYTPENNANSEFSDYYTIETDKETGIKTLKLNMDNFEENISNDKLANIVENILATSYGLSDSNEDGKYSIHSPAGSAIKYAISQNEGNNDIFRDTDVNNLSTANFVNILATALKDGGSVVCPDVGLNVRSDYQMEELEAKAYAESEAADAQRYSQLHITQESVEISDKEKFTGLDMLEYVEYKDGISLKETLQNAVKNEILDSGEDNIKEYQNILDKYSKYRKDCQYHEVEPQSLYKELEADRNALKNSVNYEKMSDEEKETLQNKIDRYENLMLIADSITDETGAVTTSITDLKYTKGSPTATTIKTLAAAAISQEMGNSKVLLNARENLEDKSKVKDDNITQLLNFNIKATLRKEGFTSVNLEDVNINTEAQPAKTKPKPAAKPQPKQVTVTIPVITNTGTVTTITVPVDPSPTDPSPTDPSPRDPSPRDPSPRDPSPVDPSPRDPSPVDPGPVDPSPVDPGPVDPSPVDPGPVDPSPADPSPADPCPSDPNPPTIEDPGDAGGGGGGGGESGGGGGSGDDPGSGGGSGAGGGGGDAGDRDSSESSSGSSDSGGSGGGDSGGGGGGNPGSDNDDFED